MLPLIRLVTYFFTDSQVVNQIKFGQKYIDKVANPESMVLMKPNKNQERRKKNANDDDFETIETVVRSKFPTKNI